MLMVRVDVPGGVTGLGANEQLVPAGRVAPEQARAIAPLKPFTAVGVIT